jgi:hypothetical protein
VTRLRIFEKYIPQSTKDRFSDLVELFSKPLYDYVSKVHNKFISISMRLIVLGERESDSKPRIVVMCDNDEMKRVKQFLRSTVGQVRVFGRRK